MLRPRFRLTFGNLLSAVTILSITALKAGIPIEVFAQNCHKLGTGSSEVGTAETRVAIKAWMADLVGNLANIPGGNGTDTPLAAIFPAAQDVVWCATSIEKFVQAHRNSFPDTLSAKQVLPLWWISVHPAARLQEKDWLNQRLKDLDRQKLSAVPRRRY